MKGDSLDISDDMHNLQALPLTSHMFIIFKPIDFKISIKLFLQKKKKFQTKYFILNRSYKRALSFQKNCLKSQILPIFFSHYLFV